MELNRHCHGHRIRNKGIDYLSIRLRRMVRAKLEEDKTSSSCSGLQFLKNEDHHATLKGIWIFVLSLCLITFLYQSYDRITYYLAYPTTTDVLITKKMYQTLPAVTVCNQETKGMFEIHDQLNLQEKCAAIPITDILQAREKIPLEEIWHKVNSTTTLVSAQVISTNAEEVSFASVPLLYGTCSTFGSRTKSILKTDGGRLQIVMKIYRHRCTKMTNIPVFIHEADDFPMSQKLHVHAVGRRNKAGVTIKKINFLNRTVSPCFAGSSYRACLEDCFTSFALRSAKCRFPFHSDHMNLTTCIASMSTYKLWQKMEAFLTGNIDNESCPCPRKCEHQTFDIHDSRTDGYDNQTILEIYFDDPHETFIQERYIYDFIHLLCDIGGSSGLYIGLSLLSIFELIHVVLPNRRKQSKFSLLDPLYFKVAKNVQMIRLPKKGGRGMPTMTLLHICRHPPVLIKLTVISASVCLFMFSVVDRIMYFRQHPLRSVVQVSLNETLETPSLTLCAGDPRVMNLQRIYATTRNISNFCDVKIWELLDMPDVNATFLWINPGIGNGHDFWRSFKLVFLHDGTCIDLDDGKTVVPSNRNSWLGTSLAPLCGTNFQKVYLRPPTRQYDYFLYRYIMVNHIQQVTFVIKEIVLDEAVDLCMSDMEYEVCKNSCMEKKLLQRIYCRLPYMLEARLPMCNTSLSAKHSHQTFLELFMLPETETENCNCLPPCRKRFYETQMSTEEQHYTSFSFGPNHNVIETYSKQSAYSLIQLFSEIGGWLGSTLGLCILSTVEGLLTLYSSLFKKKRRQIPASLKKRFANNRKNYLHVVKPTRTKI